MVLGRRSQPHSSLPFAPGRGSHLLGGRAWRGPSACCSGWAGMDHRSRQGARSLLACSGTAVMGGRRGGELPAVLERCKGALCLPPAAGQLQLDAGIRLLRSLRDLLRGAGAAVTDPRSYLLAGLNGPRSHPISSPGTGAPHQARWLFTAPISNTFRYEGCKTSSSILGTIS